MMNKRLKNRLWLVTCLALAIITTYTIYRYYCVHRIGDSDFYWHIMLGKNAISGLSADDSLVWSNSIYQTSYTNYSLLSDIILYKLSCIREDETFGALVYMLITAFITSFIVFASWGRNVIKKIGSSARSTITSISAILFSVWLLYMAKGNPRPHLMALACFVVSIGILESRKPNVSYLAIPLAVIWANLHGASMPLLIVMELLYLIVSLPIFRKLNVEVISYTKNEYVGRVLSAVLSLLAGLCNPVGIKIYTRLFHVSDNASKGYELNFNHKYPTLRPPGKTRPVRFKTLGRQYTSEALQIRILYPDARWHFLQEQPPVAKHARLRKSYGKARRLTGLRALYYRYLYELGALPHKPRRPSYAVRQDIRNLDRRIRQMEFLSANSIDSIEQLQAKQIALENKIAELQTERQRLYRTAPNSPEIPAITAALKPLRRDLKLCKEIAAHSAEMRQRLADAERERQQEPQTKPQQNQTKTNQKAR